MQKIAFRLSAAAITVLTGQTLWAGTPTQPPTNVPVDSPWALAGIGAVVAVIAARLLYKRNK